MVEDTLAVPSRVRASLGDKGCAKPRSTALGSAALPPTATRGAHPAHPGAAAGNERRDPAVRPGPRLPWMPVWCVMAPLRSAPPRPGQETAPPPAPTLPEPAPGGAAARTAPGRSRTSSRARSVRGEPAGFHVRRVVAAAASGRPHGTARRCSGIGTALPPARPAAVPPAQVPPRRRGESEGRQDRAGHRAGAAATLGFGLCRVSAAVGGYGAGGCVGLRGTKRVLGGCGRGEEPPERWAGLNAVIPCPGAFVALCEAAVGSKPSVLR